MELDWNPINSLWNDVFPYVNQGVEVAESFGVPVKKAVHKAIDVVFDKRSVTALFIGTLTRSKIDTLGTGAFCMFLWEGLARKLKNKIPIIQPWPIYLSPDKHDDKSTFDHLTDQLDTSNQGIESHIALYKHEAALLEKSLKDSFNENDRSGLYELLGYARQMANNQDPGSECTQEVRKAAGISDAGSIQDQGSLAAEAINTKIESINQSINEIEDKISQLQLKLSPEPSPKILKIAAIAGIILILGKMPILGQFFKTLVTLGLGGILGAEAYHRVVNEPDAPPRDTVMVGREEHKRDHADFKDVSSQA